MNLRSARGPAQQDVGRVQRHAEPLGVGLENPARRLPQRGASIWAAYRIAPVSIVETVTPGADILALRIG